MLNPFRDRNFRRLMSFQAAWNFAANLATPFFVAYMLTRLGYDLQFVIILSLVSQAVCAASMRLWGRYADQYSHKNVMGICGAIFVATLVGWTFTSFPERHAYTGALLFALHALMGFATAGITLTSSSMALKLSPESEVTSYLAVNSMVNSLFAGMAPLIGGLLADFFAERQLSLVLRWQSELGTHDFSTLHLGHWDFFFLVSALVGLFALNRLSLVAESGERPNERLLRELMTDAGQALRTISSVDGLRDVVSSPFVVALNLLRKPRPRPHAEPPEAQSDPPTRNHSR